MMELPKDVVPFFMSNSSAEKYGLKYDGTGDESSSLREFNTRAILEEISQNGFMSAFEPCEKYLKQCRLEHFIVVYDKEAVYGEMFLLLYSDKAIKWYRDEHHGEQPPKCKEAEEKRVDNCQNGHKCESTVKNYIKIELYPKAYTSSSVEETELEVQELQMVTKERNLCSLLVGRPVDSLGLKVQLDSYEDSELTSMINFRVRDSSDFDLYSKTSTVQVQAAFEYRSVGVKTNPVKLQHSCVQYERRDFLGDLPQELRPALANMIPRFENALLSNAATNVFQNLFHNPASPVHIKPRFTELLFKEEKNFIDLEHSKGKAVVSIDWYPSSIKKMLASAVCSSLTFDERINYSTGNNASSSGIILWSFDHYHPVEILNAPYDCTVVRFNKNKPNIVVAGCLSGQVIMWKSCTKARGDSVHLTESRLSEEEYDFNYGHFQNSMSDRISTKPTAVSTMAHSHKKTVLDLVWLQPNAQINARGEVLSGEYLSDNTYQFMSVSNDGNIRFWDVRFEDIMAGKLPHILKVRAKFDRKEGVAVWTPLFSVKLKKPEGIGELSLCQIVSFSASKFICATDDGCFVLADWQGKESHSDDDTFVDIPECVLSLRKVDSRGCVSLDLSPFLDLVLFVSQTSFSVWSTDDKVISGHALFVSHRTKTHNGCGKWSPFQSTVVFLGKLDGSIELFDLSASYYSPLRTFTATTNGIMSIEFLSFPFRDENRQELLAIGDKGGGTHVFRLDKQLTVYRNDEKQLINDFVSREKCRIKTLSSVYCCNASKNQDKENDVPPVVDKNIMLKSLEKEYEESLIKMTALTKN